MSKDRLTSYAGLGSAAAPDWRSLVRLEKVLIKRCSMQALISALEP